MQFWNSRKSYIIVEIQQDFPKGKIICARFMAEVYDRFFFAENTISYIVPRHAGAVDVFVPEGEMFWSFAHPASCGHHPSFIWP
jgi:hypothetical protein